jgi:hypothetical protein
MKKLIVSLSLAAMLLSPIPTYAQGPGPVGQAVQQVQGAVRKVVVTVRRAAKQVKQSGARVGDGTGAGARINKAAQGANPGGCTIHGCSR